MNTSAGHSAQEPLAIVGIGCHLPGGALTPDLYWELLLSGTDATRVVPETRWNADKYYDPNPKKVGKMATRRGGFLSEIDQFDPQFFGISPREANLVDPQQRLLLRTTWEALEDGGISADSLAGTDVGVFVGGFTLDYQLLQNQGRTSRYRFKTHSATGMMMTMLANRISFAFDFRGPSMTVDTACSSSLVAVHLAAQAIWNGECKLAIAGGVNVIIGPNTAIAESKSGFLAPDGRCKAFDEAADGYARGEGGAVVVIKPTAQALQDGDSIYAQILGTAVSQDGHTDGITVPSADAQEAAIITALRRAGVRPADVGYVEAHGTGTPVGDPIEVSALANALSEDRPTADPLLIGSVKTNIGHLEAGAGVAGLIKAALVVKHGYIPANLHLHNPSAQIPWDQLNIEIPRTGRPFPDTARRVAGVNSFGFGGTNAHVVLAEPPAASSQFDDADRSRRLPLALLPLSARAEDALADTARRLADHVAAHPDLTLPDLGYTLSQRRSHLTYRRTLVADSIADAHQQLQSLADAGQVSAIRASATTPRLAFVCSGMGPQWWKMCRGLLDKYPTFSESIVRSDRELSRHTDWSLIDELRADETRSRMGETDVAQPANFAIQVALAEQLREFGIVPDAVVGHSAGEVAAHYLAGILDFEQAIHVIYHRSRLQQRTSGQGRMLAVGLSAEAFIATIDDAARDAVGPRISIAAVNGPSTVTVAGERDALEEIARQLEDAGVFTRFLNGKVPYHTHFMDDIKDDLVTAFEAVKPASATTPLYSTVTGERLDGYADAAGYWWQNTRATVLFEPAIRRMLQDGYTQFVELAPHPVLASSVFEIAADLKANAVVLATQRRNEDDGRTLMNCVGALHCHGHRVAWDALYPREHARLVKLPPYPWQTRRYWNETQEAAEDLHYNPVHPLLGQPVTGIHPTWEVELSTAALPFLAEHKVQGSVLVLGAVYVEMALAAAEATYGSTEFSVDELRLSRAVILDDTCDPILRTTLNRDTGCLEFAAFTATASGDVKWTLTATAELNRLTTPDPVAAPGASPVTTTVDGDEFYTRSQSVGFVYGEALQSIAGIVCGDGWATAEILAPEWIAGDAGKYRFHPVLIDGAFQSVIGTTLLDRDGDEDAYLPVYIRRSAIYREPPPRMTAQIAVVSTTKDGIESDITLLGDEGELVATFTGFTLRALSEASHLSPERVEKGLYELEWVEHCEPAVTDAAATPNSLSWLVFLDSDGVGTSLADQLRRRGHRVRVVLRQDVAALSKIDGGYALNPRQPEQIDELIEAHLDSDGDLAGIVDCWPLDIYAAPDPRQPDSRSEINDCLGVFTVLRLVNALAEHDAARPRLYVLTANAQPVLGSEPLSVDQAAVWGLGRVVGHQEFIDRWGGLIDIDATADATDLASRICEHILDRNPEDQIALRGATTFVPRLRPAADLTPPFPTKLTPDATYVVTGGAGALGRIVAAYLAERGARHIALLSRSEIPPRDQWSLLPREHRHYQTVHAIRRIERSGACVTTAGVDITDAAQVDSWLRDHARSGGRPIRGIVHAAGSVDDRLLVNMTETDFTTVMAPKVTGTRVLHNALLGHDLEFFVMFGSAGSVIASPGQGNYAAANAFLDAFAHFRRAHGLPALTIGWGPWSVGMVEELKLEKLYAQRGIELITPSAGTAILDRLMSQKMPAVVAITADWARARRAGLGGQLPPMFSELGTAETSTEAIDSDSSVLEFLAKHPQAERLEVVVGSVQQIAAAVFEIGASDIGADDALDDLGLDSLMAMDFRLRVNATFGIDLPLLELLRGVSVNSVATRILSELRFDADPDNPSGAAAEPEATDVDVDRMVEQLSEDELRQLLAELENQDEAQA